LKKERGFVHIDLETKDLDRLNLRDAWELFWQGTNLRNFPTALDKLGSPVMLDWGFPPSLLCVVANLRDAGAQTWWFDGDRLCARSLCIKAKGPAAAVSFDCQHARIAAEWATIAAFFGDRIVRRVGPNGDIAPWPEVWARISRAA